MDTERLQRLIRARAITLRTNRFRVDSTDEPQSVTTDTIVATEGPGTRRRVVLTAHGCKVATCTMCPLPDEAVDESVPITLANWMSQLRGALDPAEDVHTLTLFHNGNFFSDREVPEPWRAAIYAWLRTTKVRELVVESLPEYLTPERLQAAREGLGPVRLSVALGLQSSSGFVREVCIGSPCRRDRFEAAVQMLRAQGDDAQVFLLFHPPFLDIAESMHDLRESIRYVQGLGAMPTVCPVRISSRTVVGDLRLRGLYVAADPWYLYDALEGFAHVRVASSLLGGNCDPQLAEAFAVLNRTATLPVIERPAAIPRIAPRPLDVGEGCARILRYLSITARHSPSPDV